MSIPTVSNKDFLAVATGLDTNLRMCHMFITDSLKCCNVDRPTLKDIRTFLPRYVQLPYTYRKGPVLRNLGNLVGASFNPGDIVVFYQNEYRASHVMIACDGGVMGHNNQSTYGDIHSSVLTTIPLNYEMTSEITLVRALSPQQLVNYHYSL